MTERQIPSVNAGATTVSRRVMQRPGKAFAREIVRLAQITIPKVAGGGFLIALNIVLMRRLDPGLYGKFALCMAVILLADAIIGSPFDLAVIRLSGKAHGRSADTELSSERAALRLKLGTIAAATLGFMLIARPAGRLSFGEAGDATLFLASSFAAATMLLLRSILVHLQIAGRFQAYAAVECVHISVKAGAVGLYLYLFEPGVSLILVLLGLGPIIAALWGNHRFALGVMSRANVPRSGYSDILAVSHWYVATIALGALIGRLDTLLIAWFGPAEKVGLFTAGQVLASLPELLGSYLAVLLTPHLVPAMRAGRLDALYRRVQPLLAATAAVLLILAFLGQNLVRQWVFQNAYAASGAVALILLPATLAGMVTIPFALPIVMFEHKRFLLLLDCFVFPVAIAAYYIVIPLHGEIGAAWIASATSLVRSLAVQAAAFRLVSAGRKKPDS